MKVIIKVEVGQKKIIIIIKVEKSFNRKNGQTETLLKVGFKKN